MDRMEQNEGSALTPPLATSYRKRGTASRDATLPTSRSPLFRAPVGEVGPTGRHPVPLCSSYPLSRRFAYPAVSVPFPFQSL